MDPSKKRPTSLLQDPTMKVGHHGDEAGVGVHDQRTGVRIRIANHEMIVEAARDKMEIVKMKIDADIGTGTTIAETEVEKGIDLGGTTMIAGQGDKDFSDCETDYNSITPNWCPSAQNRRRQASILRSVDTSTNTNMHCIVWHYTSMEYPDNTSLTVPALTATLPTTLYVQFRDMQAPSSPSSHVRSFNGTSLGFLKPTEDNMECSAEPLLVTVSHERRYSEISD
jgi:hypothetical protein